MVAMKQGFSSMYPEKNNHVVADGVHEQQCDGEDTIYHCLFSKPVLLVRDRMYSIIVIIITISQVCRLLYRPFTNFDCATNLIIDFFLFLRSGA